MFNSRSVNKIDCVLSKFHVENSKWKIEFYIGPKDEREKQKIYTLANGTEDEQRREEEKKNIHDKLTRNTHSENSAVFELNKSTLRKCACVFERWRKIKSNQIEYRRKKKTTKIWIVQPARIPKVSERERANEIEWKVNERKEVQLDVRSFTWLLFFSIFLKNLDLLQLIETTNKWK